MQEKELEITETTVKKAAKKKAVKKAVKPKVVVPPKAEPIAPKIAKGGLGTSSVNKSIGA